jgi:hypothetical protein
MKAIVSSRRNRYAARLGILLIAAALIAGTVGCASTATQYNLNITSTTGGSVTAPGEGTFTYDERAEVDLVAEAEEDYQFISWTGDVGTIAKVNAASTTVTMNGHYCIRANFAKYAPMVAAGGGHTVGLKSDGTVVVAGNDYYGHFSIDDWADIAQVAAGLYHTVGLKSDGTVVAMGGNSRGQCDVGGWMDIIRVTAGDSHTVGLKSDGTVIAGWGAAVAAWDLFNATL